MSNPLDVLAHIRASATTIALMCRNVEIDHAAVNRFCEWVEKINAITSAIPVPAPQPEKEKVSGRHNLHSPRR